MANYDLGIFIGHGYSRDGSYDSGAVGHGYRENDIARELGNLTANYLKKAGLNVHVAEQSYKDNHTKGNSYRLKMVLSYHMNSASATATGSEILVPINESYLSMETNILNRVCSLLNIPNRGVKSRDYNSEAWYKRTHGVMVGGSDYFGEIRNAWNNGVSLSIFEVAFISNKSDLDKVLANKDAIARIVSEEIAKIDGKTIPSNAPVSKPSTPSTGDGTYRVICGSYKDKSNADTRVKELSAKGVNSFIAYYDDTKTYRVVAGSYKDKANAEKQVNTLKTKGIDCFIAFYK